MLVLVVVLFSGHFGRGQLTYPHCSWASLLCGFASNWQLTFLNQRKGKNGHRNYFMTNLHERMLLCMRIEPATISIPSRRASDQEMPVLVTCKFDEDWIKTEGVSVETVFRKKIITPGQVHVTQKWMVRSRSGQKSTRPRFYASWLPASLTKIQSKMKVLAWRHQKFLDTQGHLTPKGVVQSGRNLNSSEILWLSWLPASWWYNKKWGR